MVSGTSEGVRMDSGGPKKLAVQSQKADQGRQFLWGIIKLERRFSSVNDKTTQSVLVVLLLLLLRPELLFVIIFFFILWFTG